MSALQLHFERLRVYDKEKVAFLHLLVIHDCEVDDRPADLWGDADDVGAHEGTVGSWPLVKEPCYIERHHNGAEDNGKAEESAGHAQPGWIFGFFHRRSMLKEDEPCDTG